MTDMELLTRVLGVMEPGGTTLHEVRRGGRILLGLPADREAAARALHLYQPQRWLARGLVALLRGAVAAGQHGRVLRQLAISGEAVAVSPVWSGAERGTCGVLLGSPEHRVRRAIASYRNGGAWEVAKISLGADGVRVLAQEARALDELRVLVPGVPQLLGWHQGGDLAILRMPYLTGVPIARGDCAAALGLLDQWITGAVPQAITGFPEWQAVTAALSGDAASRTALERLEKERLLAVTCHGDFARWNLLRTPDGGLVVLDWEWGHKDGLPGIDLVHYFLQDERLVRRLSPAQAVEKTRVALERPVCREYLEKTGWSGDPLLPILACLAYKQGAGHQQNGEVLAVAVARCAREAPPHHPRLKT